MPRKEGAYLVEDYFDLTGGLNSAYSPFQVAPTQASDGYNYDYSPRHGITKRAGHLGIMGTVDATNPTTLGFGLHDNFTVRTMFRAAGRVLKAFTAGSFGTTSLVQSSSYTSDDSTPITNIFANGTTTPAVFSMFNTSAASVLWCAGGGAGWLSGLYTTSASAPAHWTKNGAEAPTVTKLEVKDKGSGVGPPTGTYYNYTISLVKGSTGAESNALVGDLQGTADAGYQTGPIQGTGNALTVKWVFTGVDTTKYTKVNLYRSQAGTSVNDGNIAPGFTAGVLLTQLDIATTTYDDTNTFTSSSANIPRAGNIVLDNSTLPTSGTFNVIALWQNRLVTAVNGTLYISETNKGESWPLTNVLQVPSLGAITGLSTVSLVPNISISGIQEALVIYKEREVWTLVGNTYNDWVLARVSTEGCPNQSLVVKAGGNLAWVNYRGVFVWNGSGKPRYIGQYIEDKFNPVIGDLTLSSMLRGFGVFVHQRQQVQWYLSSNTYGTQKYVIKLDLRLAEARMSEDALNSITEGVFSSDVLQTPLYAGISFTPTQGATSELLYLGDATGQVYQGYTASADTTSSGTSPVTLHYDTPWLHLGKPEVRKNIAKVIVWVKDSGIPNLTMDYWSDFKADQQNSSRQASVASNPSSNAGVWDVGFWDISQFDPASGLPKGIVFVPDAQTNNNACGMTFKLRFRESDNKYASTIYGFSVYYTEAGTGF